MQDVLGIDLGTTNSALATWQGGDEAVRVVEIAQLASPGRVERLRGLPSFLYVPNAGELSADEARLPWEDRGDAAAVVGVWARERGALVPERLVSSAKSWLGNGHVDRYETILPWRSDITQGKTSPVEVSARYLRHLMAAYEYDRASRPNGGGAASPSVVLTVPASFDEVARNLTYEAARRAGLEQVTLLEEPLAAFYAWLAASGDEWRNHVQPGDVVLICDVGGGTSDFSLVAVTDRDGELALERISVGDHLLLGGDNMDLALAFALRRDLEAHGQSLDHWQLLALVSAARGAKERLLSDSQLAEVPISVAGRGSSLFASTVSTALTRQHVEQVLLEGFLPMTTVDEMPMTRRTVGIQEFGLSYEADAGISRHLARFLRRSRQNVQSNATLAHLVADRLTSQASHLMPTAVLFNGGVFNAPALRTRVLDLLKAWNGGEAIKELQTHDLDLAVAQGAAYYGKLRATGEGLRVQSGTARSYYVGLESPMPAVPGYAPPVKGLCLVPQGTNEGTEILLAGQQFGLVVGEPVEFRFFSSAVRAGDQVGAMVDDASELDETSRLSVTLPADGQREGDVVPVRLDAVVTEVGTLQVYMKDVGSDRKWHLEFNVRDHGHA